MVAAVRMAFDGRKLIIAAAGILLLQLGWSLLHLAFPDSVEVTPDVLPRGAAARTADDLAWSTDVSVERLIKPASNLTTPLFALLDPGSRGLAMLHALLGIAWLLVVWGYCGGAIARIAAIREARSQQTGIVEAVRFAWRSGPSLILAPVYPLVALAFCTLPGLVLGLLYRIPAGPAIAGVLLFIPLLAGLVMTLLVAALVAGWPLFHAALAAGADDALDALSRTYSYLNQRLILVAVGVAIAGAAGLAGLELVDWLAGGVLRMTRWSLSLDGPPSQISALFGRGPLAEGTAAAASHRFWLGAVRLLAEAWVYSYFWSAATLLYLWIRHEVDGTPTTVIDPPGAAARVGQDMADS
jgi:hypothetical protein